MFTYNLSEKISALLKEAEEHKKCSSCGEEMEDGRCKNPKCPKGMKDKEEDSDEEKEKEADASFSELLSRGALVLDYLSKTAGATTEEASFADYLAWESYLNKIAEGMDAGLPPTNEIPNPTPQGSGTLPTNYAADGGMGVGLPDTDEEDKTRLANQTQPIPYRGRQINASKSPMTKKKASVNLHWVVKQRKLQKLAQGAMPPNPPPTGGAAVPPPPPPGGGAPAVPPQGGQPQQAGPDPVQIAIDLQARGQLTPQNLAQAAGIPIEAATAIIAALTGTAAPPPNPPAGMTMPPDQQQGAPPVGTPGAAPPGAPPPAAGGGAPPKQSSADASLLFQEALRKYAGLEQFLGSNESATNFGADDAWNYNMQGIEQLFNHIKKTQPRKSGGGSPKGDADAVLTSTKAAEAMWEYFLR